MMRVAVILLLVVAAPAAAQPDPEAHAAYQRGQQRYAQQDYEGAAAEFEAAYALEADPVYLFNIGQAYRLANKCELAGTYYRRYLDAAKNAPNAELVEEHIAEVDRCAKERAPQPPEPATPAPVPEPPVDTAPRGGSGMRTAGIVVGAIGVALAGFGFYEMTRVSAAEQDARELEDTCAQWSERCTSEQAEIDDRGERHEKLMIGSFVGGGAAIATGVVLYVLGGKRARESVAVTPMRGGAMVSVSF